MYVDSTTQNIPYALLMLFDKSQLE